MMYSHSTKFGLTSLGQVDSCDCSRFLARESPNPGCSKNQINADQPRRPEAAVQVWVANPTMLTREILSETIRILPAKDIHDLINELIEELDCRSGDPDAEAEPTEDDDEAEAEVAEDDDESEPEPVEDDEVLESVGV